MCGSNQTIKENNVATKKTNTEKLFKTGDKIRALQTSGSVTKGKEYTVDRYSAVSDTMTGEPRLKLVGAGPYGERPNQSLFELATAPVVAAAPVPSADTKAGTAPQLPSQYSKALAQVQSLLETGASSINVSRALNGSVRVTAQLDVTFNA